MSKENSIFLEHQGDVDSKSNGIIMGLVIIPIILMSLGLINLYSAADTRGIFYGQIQNIIISLVLIFAIGWFFPAQKLSSFAFWIYIFTICILILVLLFGDISNGSRRWIGIGVFRGQPSELAKITVAIIVAKFFASNRIYSSYRLRDLWPVALYVGLIFFLIAMQPDLGTAGLCVIIACSQISFMNLNKKSVITAGIATIIFFIVGWFFLLHDYQKLRILNFLNPQIDPFGSGYNIQQSLIAVGSGSLFGKGFLQGSQTQLEFLPARHTDFILSVFAEENGFFATLTLISMYFFLTFLCLEIARRAKNTFSSLLAIGIATNLFTQFFINVAMVLGMFPVVGVPLPLFSHGGSSLITSSIGLGLLIAICRYNHGKIKDRSLTIKNLLKPL